MKLLNIIKKHPKTCILLVFILLLLIFPFPKQLDETPEAPEETRTSEPPVNDASLEIPAESVIENIYFESDNLVNSFFEKYNAVSSNPIDVSDIEKGNIDTKALVYSDMFSMEVVNSGLGFLSVSISTDPENENTYLNDMFSDCIKAMNATLSDEDIDAAWNALHETGYMVEAYDLDGISITYIPYTELSRGHSDLRIDIIFSV